MDIFIVTDIGGVNSCGGLTSASTIGVRKDRVDANTWQFLLTNNGVVIDLQDVYFPRLSGGYPKEEINRVHAAIMASTPMKDVSDIPQIKGAKIHGAIVFYNTRCIGMGLRPLVEEVPIDKLFNTANKEFTDKINNIIKKVRDATALSVHNIYQIKSSDV